MAVKARDLLVPVAAMALIAGAIVFAIILPALELGQVERRLEILLAASPGVTETPVFPPNGTIVQGPPGFTLLVTPVEARAPPGGVIVYNITVEPRGGFDEQISLHLDLQSLLLYRQSFDLGTVEPPYPTTFDDRFTVPPDIPSGITVNEVLSGEGGGYRDTVDLVLLVT
jgi:hypothetical protein